MESNNTYTNMQKTSYSGGTSNHPEHNDNPDYWDILLGDLKNKDKWEDKLALDFACGKGRNIVNMFSIANFSRIDGIDISKNNINWCLQHYNNINSNWYCNNGINVSDLQNNEYDFIMSTIALQHIPVYDIRKSLITDLLRVLKPGGLFSFQMGYGKNLDDQFNRPRSPYFANEWTAKSTNSGHDVRVQSEKEIIDDLKNIGFTNITTQIKESYSDAGHPQWIYIKCYKP
jgi:ubiquinone/menaquinone biosynthesis C-methylase UbiE